MVHIDREGNRIGGADAGVNRAGFVIHRAILEACPDLHAACHMHIRYGRAWSTFGRGIDMLNQDSCTFYEDPSVYAGFGGVVLVPEEGVNIARTLGPQ